MNALRIVTVALIGIALTTATVPGAEAGPVNACELQGINVWDNIDEVSACATDAGRDVGVTVVDLLCAAIC